MLAELSHDKCDWKVREQSAWATVVMDIPLAGQFVHDNVLQSNQNKAAFEPHLYINLYAGGHCTAVPSSNMQRTCSHLSGSR